MEFFKNFKTYHVPTMSQANSAIKLGVWFALIMISNSLIMGCFQMLMNKAAQWKLKRQMAKLQNELMVEAPAEEAPENA